MTRCPSAAVLPGAISLVLSVLFAARATAFEPLSVDSPVSPQESLEHFVVEPGFTVELVAHEPAVIDPVAIRFDEMGRMWVVEMRDYPNGPQEGEEGRSRISVLEDRDDDGYFETATVFADGLRYATGLQPWKGGVFVTMEGEIAYMKDTSGDGRADVVETWYTGFARENPQLRANAPRLALDHHIYVANGLRGGTIVDARNPDAGSVSISGSDFRFDPTRGTFEAVSGVCQFGLTFDDYGNRFVCTNRNPLRHVVLENAHLKKNPLVAAAEVAHDVAAPGELSHIFPVTRAWTTSNLHAGQFTAACSATIYRGGSFPQEYWGNAFTCDPTGHLVHREIVRSQGVTFNSVPATPGHEFLASRDAWCCPVNLEVGPDGALYLVDMYRAVIEHPEFMPTELRKRPDLLDGDDRGRIYRVVPTSGIQRGRAPRLAATSSEELVYLLAHRNAWWRETAARLLLERQDKTIGDRLTRIALEHEWHIARIHALRMLDGLNLVTNELLFRALADPHSRIIEHAIVLAESRVEGSAPMRERISQLAAHSDARVRFAVLLTALPMPQPPAYPVDEWELLAMMIAAGDRGGIVLADFLESNGMLDANLENCNAFVADLARQAAASNDSTQLLIAVEALVDDAEYQNAGLASLFGESSRCGLSIDAIESKLTASVSNGLARAFESAQQLAEDIDQPAGARSDAIALLANLDSARSSLAELALHESEHTVRLAAIRAITANATLEPWSELLAGFSNETPAIQRQILEGILAQPQRTTLLMDEIAAARIKPSELGSEPIARLLQHQDAELRSRAAKLFAEAVPRDREMVLAEYQVALSLQGDPKRGRDVFEKRCATCHRISDVGVSFAPDISDSREKLPEQLLVDILQPNRAIDSNYFSYTAIMVDGSVHAGIVATETATSITLKQAENKSLTLSRSDIEELRSSGVSLMPEGMEKEISPQDMADLIGFIKNWRYLEEATK